MSVTFMSSGVVVRDDIDSVAVLIADRSRCLTPYEAREMARGLCNAAERVEDAQTESEHSAA